MKFSNSALKTFSLSSFFRATALLSTFYVVKVDGQVDLSSRDHHTCAFDHTSAELKCWGRNVSYQLNTGTQQNAERSIDVVFPGVAVVDAQAGGDNTCVVSDVGGISCVGKNYYGELGIGSRQNPIKSPTATINLTEKVAKVYPGWLHTCSVYILGGLSCTGRNNRGQLGLGDDSDRSAPTPVDLDHGAIDVALGWEHTCVIDSENNLLCTGLNNHGQLGLGDNINRNTLTIVNFPGGETVVELACGYQHTCIIDNKGAVQCMGRNHHGQFGNGNTNENVNIPTSVPYQENDAIKISVSERNTCFIQINDTMWCMGDNSFGQLGNITLGEGSKVPVRPDLPESVTPVDIVLGSHHSCVTITNSINKIYCWGRNDYGQLGTKDRIQRNTPTLVELVDFPTSPPVSTASPTAAPTAATTTLPSQSPTTYPSAAPSTTPSTAPSALPSQSPTTSPSTTPSASPTTTPTTLPSQSPTISPTALPTEATTISPTKSPTSITAPTTATTPPITPTPTITSPKLNEWLLYITGDTIEQVISIDTISISMPFNASNRDIGALVFQEDCITPFDSSGYFSANTTPKISTTPDGFIQFNTTLNMNITAINGTKFWKTFTDGTRGGWVEACVETYLSFTDNLNLGNDDAVQKVNFKNNVLNISVSLSASYEVDQVSVAREEATKEDVKTDYSEFIRAFECEDTDPYAQTTGRTYNQGDEIAICVTDESGGIVQVEEFVNLVVAQEGVSDYNFILNSLYNPDITSPECLDATASERRVCHVKIRALARFFEGEAPKDLTISGSVYVIRDGRRVRRNLRMALPGSKKTNKVEDHNALDVVAGRRDEEEEEGRGEFQLQVSLTSADDSAATPGGRIVRSAVVGGLMSMAIGAASIMI